MRRAKQRGSPTAAMSGSPGRRKRSSKEASQIHTSFRLDEMGSGNGPGITARVAPAPTPGSVVRPFIGGVSSGVSLTESGMTVQDKQAFIVSEPGAPAASAAATGQPGTPVPPMQRTMTLIKSEDGSSQGLKAPSGEMRSWRLVFPNSEKEQEWHVHLRASRRTHTLLISLFGTTIFGLLALTDAREDAVESWFTAKFAARLAGTGLLFLMIALELLIKPLRGYWQEARAIIVLVPVVWAVVFSPASGLAKNLGLPEASELQYFEVRFHPSVLLIPIAGPVLDCQHPHVLFIGLIAAAVDVSLSIAYDMYHPNFADFLIMEHIGIWGLIIAFAVKSAYDSEKAARVLFLQNRSLHKENAKLAAQIVRQTTHKGQGVDLTTNAERLLQGLKGVQDKMGRRGSVDKREVHLLLEHAIGMLKSGDLFGPTNVLRSLEGSPEVDHELRQWLLDDMGLANSGPMRRARSARTLPESQRGLGSALHSDNSISVNPEDAKSTPESDQRTPGTPGVDSAAGASEDGPTVPPTPNVRLVKDFAKVLDYDQFDLDLLSMEAKEPDLMLMVVHSVLRAFGVVREMRIPNTVLVRFLKQLQDGYIATNPYHNATHAASVAWDVQWYLGFGGLVQFLNPVEVYAAIIAAAGHDFRHPGRSNQFLVNRVHEIAITHNDKSPLERFHCAELFRLGLSEDTPVFRHLSAEDLRVFRRTSIAMILATDVSKHFKHVAKLKMAHPAPPDADEEENIRRLSVASVEDITSGVSAVGSSLRRLTVDHERKESEMEDVRMMLNSVIMMADLGHAAKPFEQHRRWTERVSEEFFRQGDEERGLGMNISPLCDRETTDVASSQLGFFDFLVRPLWTAVQHAHPIRGFRSRVLVHVASNYSRWKVASAESKEARLAISRSGSSRTRATLSTMESGIGASARSLGGGVTASGRVKLVPMTPSRGGSGAGTPGGLTDPARVGELPSIAGSGEVKSGETEGDEAV